MSSRQRRKALWPMSMSQQERIWKIGQKLLHCWGFGHRNRTFEMVALEPWARKCRAWDSQAMLSPFFRHRIGALELSSDQSNPNLPATAHLKAITTEVSLLYLAEAMFSESHGIIFFAENASCWLGSDYWRQRRRLACCVNMWCVRSPNGTQRWPFGKVGKVVRGRLAFSSQLISCGVANPQTARGALWDLHQGMRFEAQLLPWLMLHSVQILVSKLQHPSTLAKKIMHHWSAWVFSSTPFFNTSLINSQILLRCSLVKTFDVQTLSSPGKPFFTPDATPGVLTAAAWVDSWIFSKNRVKYLSLSCWWAKGGLRGKIASEKNRKQKTIFWWDLTVI